MSSIAAIVASEPQDGKVQWQHSNVQAPRQPQGKELLVRVHAVGICHTDIFCSSVPKGVLGLNYPKVLGHEGAGEVEAVGPDVTVAKVGDRVLLSYNFCSTCDLCKENKQPYCENFHPLNGMGEPDTFKLGGGKAAGGKFFGQSSFASLTIVDEPSVVNVHDLIKSSDELKKYAPFGCGLMTGTGAVLNNVKPSDILVIAGIGAVGAAAIMAAKIVGCRAIIAVDLIESRLNIAKDIGATHTYNSKNGSSFVTDIQALVNNQRLSYAIDTTGVPSVIENLLLSLGKRGKLIQIGVPNPTATITLPLGDFFFQNKVFEVNYLGDARAKEILPKMIQWHKEGKFPAEKLIRLYPATDVNVALEDMKSDVIKPILTF